jgi:hypothetical protein
MDQLNLLDKSDVPILDAVLSSSSSNPLTILNDIANHQAISRETKSWFNDLVNQQVKQQHDQVLQYMHQCVFLFRLQQHVGATSRLFVFVTDCLMKLTLQSY